ncbi:MAG: hypothetical protein MI810_24330 [Flavobacteriales bacterium]|nr:hypothetical protein [Flavobacteriales bacterium]
MKTIVKIILMNLFCSIGTSGSAQFMNKEGIELAECDCKERLRNLDVNVKLPNNYYSYDFVQFVLYANGKSLSSITRSTKKIKNALNTFNVLNSKNAGYQSLFGKEYGLYRGNDFRQASYNSLCEGDGITELQLIAYGISQTGTEYYTEYESAGDGKVRAKTQAVKVYDDGVKIAQTKSLNIKQDGFKELVTTHQKGNNVALIAGGAVLLGYLGFLVVGSL